jgi:SET domain-containing protein
MISSSPITSIIPPSRRRSPFETRVSIHHGQERTDQEACQPRRAVRSAPFTGAWLWRVRAAHVSHEEADARYENKDPNDNHTFLFTVDSKTVIDGGVGGNDARFINHGCDPNCESTTVNKRIFVEAIRTIQPGEELAYDYQIERDPEDPPNVDEIFACRCGAANCRGSMLVAAKKPRKKPLPGAAARPLKKAAKKAKKKSRSRAADHRLSTRRGARDHGRKPARGAAAR